MAQKATRLHTLSDIDKQSDNVGQIECYNCKLENKNEPANMYCNNCEEFYCNRCTKLHKSQKATRSHELVDSKTVKAKDCKLCDDCLMDKLKNKAVCFCKECKVFYCENCRLSHLKVKTTREHKLISDKEIADEYSNDCDQCNHFNKQSVKATSFCQLCDEFLCKKCSDEHKDKRITRSHSLITSIEGSIIKLSEPQLPCEPCKEDDITIRAISFCQECKELLCRECVKQHKRHRPTRSHKLHSDVETIRELLYSRLQHNREPVDDSEGQSDKIRAEADHGKVTTLGLPKNEIPGKPYAKDIKADSLLLAWEKPDTFQSTDSYQVRYKDIDQRNGKWHLYGKESDVASSALVDLKANTNFIFQVRVIHQDGNEGQYSEESDRCKTEQSPAARLIQFAKVVEKGKPSPNKHALPITEIKKGRNKIAKTRKFEIEGTPRPTTFEKTIMLVGATGTGKSTLVDGLVNYILGVKWDDPFRFTIIDLEDEEKDRHTNQALSQTEWITCYSINPQPGSRLDYRLNIIDTPGFGDTRGINRDQQIIEQIRHLFSEVGEKGIANIDSVCFLVKAPDARLTAIQTYIFELIMSLFGQDIENNINTLVTFADGLEPPVLAALQQSGLPFGKSFMFNNSGLFSKNVEIGSSSLSPMFWKMGCQSFGDFFAHLNTMEMKSLQQSKQVLDERQRLETTIQNLLPEINAGLSKQNELKTECRIFEQHKSDIAANADFEYEVEETHTEKIELPKGQHTTNCLNCNVTCHKSCAYANDEEKKNCCAMDYEGNCTQCSDKCPWNLHSNTPFIFEYAQVKKKKTYADKQEKYKKLLGETPTHKNIIERMTIELKELNEGIENLMTVHKDCHERLKQIALRPNPLNMVEHIDMMIKGEEMEKKNGFMGRIEMLKEHRQKSQIASRVQTFRRQTSATMKEVPTITSATITAKPKIGLVGKFRNLINF